MNNRAIAIIGSRGYPSYYGGFETLVRRLAPFLADEGWDVTVYGRTGATVEQKYADDRVRSISSVGFDSQSLSTPSYGLTSTISASARRPDVAFVMNVANGFWLPALKARGVKTVVNVDGIEWERDKWGSTAKRVFKAGARATARFADELVFDSRKIGDYWLENYGRPGHFIPYGGEVDYPKPAELLFPARSYALVVARFVPENTIDEFLGAAELIDDFDVVIVGSSGFGGPYDDRVESLARRKSNVHWLGHVKDDVLLFSLWENCAVYFHGHSVGGTNPALVQAMACGAATVARDTIYNVEVLGDGAVFVAPEPTAIARAMNEVFHDVERQRALSAAARSRAVVSYSWPSVCESYSGLFTSVCG